MAKFQSNFYSLPAKIVGPCTFTSKSTLNGKRYKDMTDEEKVAFRQLFIDAGATSLALDDNGKFENNFYLTT